MLMDRRRSDSRATENGKAWRARVRATVLVAAVATVLSPLGLPVADPVVVEARMEDQVPDPCDFATSGGYVISDAGLKANFGAHGGCKHGEFWGHLNFVDHATGYHVNSVEVTAYLAPLGVNTPVRDICGLAKTNNPADPELVWFRVRVMDNGEPGGLDQFGLKLSIQTEDGFQPIYEVSPRALGTAKPGAGNVQIHDGNPSTVVPGVPDQYSACGGLSFGGDEEEE